MPPETANRPRGGEASSSSVHPIGTTDQRSIDGELEQPDQAPPQTTSQWRMHRRHERRRHVIIHALSQDPDDHFARHVDRMWDCCRYPSIWDTGTERIALSLSRCKCRLCPLCADARARECSQRTERLVATMNAPRFLTLTLTASDSPLPKQLDALTAAFRRLRNRRSWKQHVHAAIYAIEITLNITTGQWHPHLHIIADGQYFPHALLKSEWTEVTAGSSIVDIRAIPDRARAARYIATYITKPAYVEHWQPDQICEYAAAIHGRRMLHTTGKMHGATPDRDDEAETGKCTEQICSLAEIRNAAEAADPRAIRAVELMQRMGGFWRRLTLYHADDHSTPSTPLSAAEHAELRTLIIDISAPTPDTPPENPTPPCAGTPRLFDVAPNAPNAQRHR